MSDALDQNLLAAILNSWNRNNIIMLNYERIVSVFEEAAEFARNVPEEEWMVEHDRASIAQMLEGQCRGGAGRTVRGRVLAGRDLDLNYDHPVLLLQLLLWHEGYHHGQILTTGSAQSIRVRVWAGLSFLQAPKCF